VDFRTDLLKHSETPHGTLTKYVTQSFRNNTGSASRDAYSVYSESYRKSTDSREMESHKEQPTLSPVLGRGIQNS
jgi:hypothetical protein